MLDVAQYRLYIAASRILEHLWSLFWDCYCFFEGGMISLHLTGEHKLRIFAYVQSRTVFCSCPCHSSPSIIVHCRFSISLHQSTKQSTRPKKWELLCVDVSRKVCGLIHRCILGYQICLMFIRSQHLSVLDALVLHSQSSLASWLTREEKSDRSELAPDHMSILGLAPLWSVYTQSRTHAHTQTRSLVPGKNHHLFPTHSSLAPLLAFVVEFLKHLPVDESLSVPLSCVHATKSLGQH